MNSEVRRLFDFGDRDVSETVQVIAGSVAALERVAEEDVKDFLFPNPIINGDVVEASWANNDVELSLAITAAKALVRSAPDLSDFNVGDEGDRRALINFASAGLLDVGFRPVERTRDHSAVGGIVKEFFRRARATAASRTPAYRAAIVRSLASLATRLTSVVRSGKTGSELRAAFAEAIAEWARDAIPAVVQEVRDIVRTVFRSTLDDGRWFYDNYALAPSGAESADGRWLIDNYEPTGATNAGPARIKQALVTRLAELSGQYRVVNRRLVANDPDMTFSEDETREGQGDGERREGGGAPDPQSGGSDPEGRQPSSGDGPNDDLDGGESAPVDAGGRDDQGRGAQGEGRRGAVGSGGRAGGPRSVAHLREYATLSGLSVRNVIRKIQLEALLGLVSESAASELVALYNQNEELQVDNAV